MKKGIKLDFICMTTNLMKNKKMQQKFHERYLYPKLQQILRRGSA